MHIITAFAPFASNRIRCAQIILFTLGSRTQDSSKQIEFWWLQSDLMKIQELLFPDNHWISNLALCVQFHFCSHRKNNCLLNESSGWIHCCYDLLSSQLLWFSTLMVKLRQAIEVKEIQRFQKRRKFILAFGSFLKVSPFRCRQYSSLGSKDWYSYHFE